MRLSSRGVKVLFLVAVAVCAFFWLSPVKVVYTMDRSLPYKWWLWSSAFIDLRRFDYVEFDPPIINQYTRNKVLVKRIVCVAKDWLEVKGLSYYCNGVFLADVKTQDAKGRPVKPFLYSGYIPEGCYFVLGMHERSYDSRYLGFVCRKHIRAKLYPIASKPDLDKIFLGE